MVATWIAAIVARFICRVQDEMRLVRARELAKQMPDRRVAGVPGSGLESPYPQGSGPYVETTGKIPDLAKAPPRKRPGLGTLRQQAEFESMADMNKSARIIKANTEALQ